jgi:type IV secretion system protein VirB6
MVANPANWHFFATIYTALTTVIHGSVNGIINGGLAYVRPVLLLAITAWISFQAIVVAKHLAPFSSLWRGVIRCAVVVMILQSAATYNQWVVSLAQAIPTEVGAAITQGGGNAAGGAAFDNVFNTAAKAGLSVYDAIPGYSLKTLPFMFLVLIYIVVAFIAVFVGFIVYLASTILLYLLLAVGPLFVALFAFPQTAKFAAGWVAALVSCVLTQLFAVAILVLFTGVENVTIGTMVAAIQGNGNLLNNFVDCSVSLVEAAAVMALIALLLKQAPSFAATISGGVYQNVASVVGAPTSIAKGASDLASGARNMAQKMGGGGGNTAPAFRQTQPTGRSLSSG